MPFVDRRVVLKSRVRALPGGPGDLVPELAGLDGLRNLAVRATLERPVPVLLQRVEERVRNPHAVIRVLARHGLVGLAVPIGVVLVEYKMGEAFACVREHPLDIRFRHRRLPGGLERVPERDVLLRVRLNLRLALPVRNVAGLQHGVQPLGADLRASDHGGHFLLFDHFPLDELLHVGVVEVQAHHLGRASRGPAGLDGTGGAVPDPKKRHQSRGLASPREGLAFPPQLGEVRSRARAVLEDPRFTGPQVHDPAVVDEIILDGLDEAVMHHDIVGKVLTALGLYVIDWLNTKGLDTEDLFIPQRRETLPRKSMRTSHFQLPALVFRDEPD